MGDTSHWSWLILAVLLGLVPAAIASKKGYSFGRWWAYGTLLWIVVFPVSLLLKRKDGQAFPDANGGQPATLDKCPDCGHEVSTRAASCPHCGAPVQQAPAAKTQASDNPVIPTSVVVVVLLVLGIWIYAKVGDTTSGSSDDDQTTTMATPPTASPDAGSNAPTFSFSATVGQIVSAYAANSVAADDKYKNKRFTISGYIDNINTDIMGHAVIELRDGLDDDGITDPRATLMDKDKRQAANLSIGQLVALVCVGKGVIVKTPMLGDCVILGTSRNSVPPVPRAAVQSAGTTPQSGSKQQTVGPNPAPMPSSSSVEPIVRPASPSTPSSSLPVPPAEGPSFDCTRAFYPDEKAICASPTLSALDRRLSRMYFQARSVAPDPKVFREKQNQAIIDRRKCGGDEQCIANWYQQRMQQLASELTPAAGS